MSFKISIPNKSKINLPLMKSDLHPKGGPLPSDINGTHSDKIRRPSNSDRLKSNDNIQRPSVMKSGESTPRLENDIFSKKPSFLYTSTFCSDRIPSDMDLCASALKVENDIFSKKPSFLYAKSTRQMGVEKDIFSNKPSFLYIASEEHPASFRGDREAASTFGLQSSRPTGGSDSRGSAVGDREAAATFGGDHVAASDIIEINPVNKDKNFSRNFIYERKETIDSLDNAPWGAPYERRY